MLLRLGVLLSIFVVAAAIVFAAAPTLQSPDECHEFDRVDYTKAQEPLRIGTGETATEVIVRALTSDTVQTEDLKRLEKQSSPYGTAFFVMQNPDTSGTRPLKTVLHVFGNKARPLALRIEVTNHAYDVRARWINEKLLSLQVWLGRIVSWDLILDIETRRFIYAEDANYGSLIVPCTEKTQIK